MNERQNDAVVVCVICYLTAWSSYACWKQIDIVMAIVQVGFGWKTDLQRLCESYPQLPCFGGSAVLDPFGKPPALPFR